MFYDTSLHWLTIGAHGDVANANGGSESWHGVEPASSLWEGRQSLETLRRIPQCRCGTSCLWNKAPPGPRSSGLSGLTASGLRLTRQPRPWRATYGISMTPAAGACQPKRHRPWEHGCMSFGCGFETVSRPAHATPAHTPTTICAGS